MKNAKIYLHGSYARKTPAQKKASQVASKYPSRKIEIIETDSPKVGLRFTVISKTKSR